MHAMAETKLRILIADDYDIVREGTCAVIERQPGWVVCGTAKTGREAVELTARLKPDVVVMDMAMPELNGLDATRQIKKLPVRTEVLIFTAHETDDLIREVFEAGAKSFINKSEAHTYLTDAIESLSRHDPFFTARVFKVLFTDVIGQPKPSRDQDQAGQRLSTREREIVQLLAEGKSNKQVANALGLSTRTVETHRATAMRKVGVDSVAGLVRYAIRHHMIEA
jgi:DNA-binding NarL/FixJ family response regulator